MTYHYVTDMGAIWRLTKKKYNEMREDIKLVGDDINMDNYGTKLGTTEDLSRIIYDVQTEGEESND